MPNGWVMLISDLWVFNLPKKNSIAICYFNKKRLFQHGVLKVRVLISMCGCRKAYTE
jgi:hypothetical protein